MLIEFRVANHRSIREEQVFSFEAGEQSAVGDTVARSVPGHPKPLLPAAALYGANASGKSNVLAALEQMRRIVIDSHRRWDPQGGVEREPFAWGPSRHEPSLFEAIFLSGGQRYEYGFVADDEHILEEWLYAFPRARRQVWFEREGQSFKFGEHLTGENRTVEKATRTNALFLSAAAQLNHEQLTPIFSWFRTQQFVRVGPWSKRRLGKRLEQWLASTDSPHRRENVLGLLRAADLGIVDVRVDQMELGFFKGIQGPKPLLQYQVSLGHQTSHGPAWLPLEEESHGTQTLSRIAPSIIDSLETGALLVVDELEAGLHPLLAMNLVHLFNESATNPRNAQLLFTTHDTNLLGHVPGEPLLRRDQVWLTEKDPEGATRLYPLTDYKPRKGENLERGYLQGRYGAIPFLGDLVRSRG